MISDIIIRKKIHKFLDKIKKHISENESFIYFPLHSEPEAVLNIESMYFSNQIEIIKHIAKSIPVSHVLYVKEHPIAVQKNARNILFYKEILEIPNVKLFHPLASQNEFLEKCSMVITITGTSGLEGILHDKPVIVFSNPRYSILPFVTIVKKNEELAKIISKKMELKTDFESLSKFVDFTINDSFNLDLIKLVVAQTERFYEIGVVALDKTITTKKVENFINEFSEEFNEIAENYKQKINF